MVEGDKGWMVGQKMLTVSCGDCSKVDDGADGNLILQKGIHLRKGWSVYRVSRAWMPIADQFDHTRT